MITVLGSNAEEYHKSGNVKQWCAKLKKKCSTEGQYRTQCDFCFYKTKKKWWTCKFPSVISVSEIIIFMKYLIKESLL